MKKLLLTTALIISSLAVSAVAGTHKLPKEEPAASITFPDSWTVEATDESINANSDDNEIYINVEIHDAESIEGAIEETFGYLKKNKVSVNKDSEKKSEFEANGMQVVDFSWDGEDKDGPCKISVTIAGVSDEKALVFLYWATPDGEKKHEKELGEIAASIKPVKK